MKQNLTVEDLNSLTFSQKQTLNSMWIPAKYDLAVASVCKDAENDLYEDLEFVVGDIILTPGSTTLTLERLRLPGDFSFVDEEQTVEDEDSSEEVYYDNAIDPGDYFHKEDCLPLLNIGQLIEMIRRTKSGHDGFSLVIPQTNGFESEEGFIINDRFGEVERDAELIDLLFKILKEQL
jgi:hypothetical protein